MGKRLLNRLILLLIIILINFNTLWATSIQDLEKGKFYLDTKDGQILTLIANKAKLSKIIEEISIKMNINIKLEGGKSNNELITINLIDKPLAEVLKRIIPKNYIISFHKVDNKMYVSKGNLFRSGDLKEDYKINFTDSYNFPIRPGMKEWKQLKTLDDMYKATQIPEDILNTIDTTKLINSCLRHPLSFTIAISNTLQKGFNRFKENFNGLQEMLSRKDAGEKILLKYYEMDPEEVINLKEELTRKEKGDFLSEFTLIEMMLAQDDILSGLSSSDRKNLVEEALEKYEVKTRHPDYYGFLGLSPCGLIMKRVMEKEGFIGLNASEENDKEEVDAHNIDKILSDARKFIERQP